MTAQLIVDNRETRRRYDRIAPIYDQREWDDEMLACRWRRGGQDYHYGAPYGRAQSLPRLHPRNGEMKPPGGIPRLGRPARQLKAKVATLKNVLEQRFPGAVSKEITGGEDMDVMGQGGKGMGGGESEMGGSADQQMNKMMFKKIDLELQMMEVKSK